MPEYESVCLKCGKYHTYISTVSSRNETPTCCGTSTDKRILTAAMGVMDYQPWEAYESPASGKIITSKKEREMDFKNTKTRPYEGREQEQKEIDRQKAYAEKELDDKVDKTVRQAWASLSPTKKAQALKEAGA
jgi:hypothetical protein